MFLPFSTILGIFEQKSYPTRVGFSATTDTPPTFLVLADDDQTVPPRNSIEFYSALKAKGVSAELHIFREGGHGFGMTKMGKPHDQWPQLLIDWMTAGKILK